MVEHIKKILSNKKMAKTKYSESFGRASRNAKTIERGEYLSRAREFAKRGKELPQDKLLEVEVERIRSYDTWSHVI